MPVQVARAGGDYSDDRTVVLRDVIWLDDEAMPGQQAGGDAPLYSALEIAEALGLKPGEKPTTMVDWMVGIAGAARPARRRAGADASPGPIRCPANLSLTDPVDARYLNTERDVAADRTIVINRAVDAWLNNTEEKPIWPAVRLESARPRCGPSIGLVDNPYRAEQRLLTLDLADGPVVLFGAAGRGKTTFIKTLLTGAGRHPLAQ